VTCFDPLLVKVRGMPEFAEIRALGIACQQHFFGTPEAEEFGITQLVLGRFWSSGFRVYRTLRVN
jgi:hypothetical protein